MNDKYEFREEQEPSVRRKSPLHPAAASGILASLAFLLFLFNTYSSVALPILPVITVLSVFASGAFAYTVLIKPVFSVIPAILTLAVAAGSFFLLDIETGTLLICVFPSLSALLSGAAIGVLARKRASMTSAVIAGAALPAVIFVSVTFIHSYIVTGSPIETVRALTEELRAETLSMMNEYITYLSESLGQKLPDLNVEGMVNDAFNTLPGMLVAFSTVLSYLCHKAMLFTAGVFGIPSDISDQTRHFEMSTASAVIYCGSFILALLSGGGIVYSAAQNIALCFIPGLALSGAKSLFAERKNGIVRIGCMPIIIFIFLLFMNPALALELLALGGAAAIIKRGIGGMKKKK